MRMNLLYAAVGAALCAVVIQPADAQRGGHGQPHYGDAYHGRSFYGRDFHRFSPAERHVWQRGRWVHGWHSNRFAWWWVVDGFWYFYPAPIYPYPTYVPPAIIVQQAPPAPTGLPPAQYWYYCDNPAGYYPYVASCGGPWRPVPVTPPGRR